MASNAIEIFEVQLDQPNRVFYPGETVSGRIKLHLKEHSKIKELRLECRGEAYVNWPEYSGSHTRYHYNRERFFSTMAVILGEGKNKKNGMNSPTFISEGSYRFSFKFVIPDKYLPTSFEGRHGNIRYWARAVIERGLGKKKIKTKPAQFLIGDYVALEDFEDVSDPVIEEDSRTLGWSCMASGTLVIRAEIDRGGFKQGDNINISVLVANETSRNVAYTEMSLIQRVLFVGVEGGKTFNDQTVCYVRKQGVLSGWEQDFPNISLAIPPKTYPTLISCKCIAVLYFILVKAKVKGKLSKDGYLEIPVVIACSDDQSEMLAQLSTQANMTSQKPKRRKGTFFCITGNTSLMGGLNSSKSEYFKEDENDQYVFSPTFRSVGSYEGTFTDIANVYNSRNGKIPRGKVSIGHYTENSNVARNGRVKLVSVV